MDSVFACFSVANSAPSGGTLGTVVLFDGAVAAAASCLARR